MASVLDVLLQITIYAGILFLVIVAFKKIFHKHISASLNYLVWALLIVRLLVPVTIESDLRLLAIPADKAPVVQSAAEAQSQRTQDITPALQQSQNALTQSEADSRGVTPQTHAAPASAIDWKTAVVFTWIFGMMVYLACMVFLHMRFRNVLKRSTAYVPSDIRDIVEMCKKELHINASIKVAFQNNMNTPALTLSLRPVLLLPEAMLFMSRDQIELCIRHELTHYKRKDHIASLLLLLVRGVYWFNPLVWIAYRMIMTDMETACDAKVAARLEKEQKRLYINTLIDFGSNEQPYCALGMGLGKKNMERRIRRMFTMKKSKRFALAVATLLVPVMLMVCFTTACQPTFSKIPSIEKKIDGHMQAQINPSERITINVDADVMLPEYDRIPIVRVAPKHLSMEQINTFVSLVSKGEPVYYSQGYAHHFTQEELDVVLPKLKGYLDNKELSFDYRRFLEDRISEYEKGYEYTPTKEKEKSKPYDGTLNAFSDHTTLKCYLGNNIGATLDIWQSSSTVQSQMWFNNSGGGSYSLKYNYYEPYEGVPAKRMKLSYEKAKMMAEDFVQKLYGENNDMIFSRTNIAYKMGSYESHNKETSPQAYAFSFVKSYNGVEVRPIIHLWLPKADEIEIDYDKRISPDSLSITIDDDGIIEVIWGGCLEYVETVSDDVAILEFGLIEKKFEEHCQSFSWLPEPDKNEYIYATIDIKRIEMNTMVIFDKDSQSYITIPVWDFIGDMVLNQETSTTNNYYQNEHHQEDVSIMTLSAIDGSIMDRSLDY